MHALRTFLHENALPFWRACSVLGRHWSDEAIEVLGRKLPLEPPLLSRFPCGDGNGRCRLQRCCADQREHERAQKRRCAGYQPAMPKERFSAGFTFLLRQRRPRGGGHAGADVIRWLEP